MTITEVLVPAQQVAWLPWAVQYFFYIGSAYGAAVLFALALFFNHRTSHQLRTALALVLAISAMVGPLALTAELHQPGRAWHFFAYLTPWSWMSRGALLLPLFSMLAVVTAWLYLRSDLRRLATSPSSLVRLLSRLTLGNWEISNGALKIISLLTLLSGLSIALYTGSEVAVIRSRPLWNQFTSPLIWFVSAFLGTGGLTLLLLLLLPAKNVARQDIRFISKTLSFSALLACLLFPLWLVNGQGLSLLNHDIWLWRTGLLMVLLLVSLLASYRFSGGLWQMAAMSLLSIAACWYLRWVTILDVQTIPRYDAGIYPNPLDWGSAGVLGIVGMAGLWLAMAAVTSEIAAPTDRTNSSSSLTQASQGGNHE